MSHISPKSLTGPAPHLICPGFPPVMICHMARQFIDFHTENTRTVKIITAALTKLHTCGKSSPSFRVLKGALSREFCGFLAQTILKLVAANLIHSEHLISLNI